MESPGLWSRSSQDDDLCNRPRGQAVVMGLSQEASGNLPFKVESNRIYLICFNLMRQVTQ